MKRFGRNQKRRLRARIDQLELVGQAGIRSREYARRLEHDILSWASRIQTYLGLHSSFNQHPNKVATDGELRQVPIPGDVVKYVTEQTMADSIEVEFMHRFCSVIEEIPHEYRYLIKVFEVDDKVQKTYFSVSKTEFERYGLQDDFIRYLSDRIAADITQCINSNRSAA